jgi:3-hydroxybutyryl-CoA dehydrogenase
MDPRTIGVVGAGQMGAGIALACAEAGLAVRLHDLRPELIDRGLAGIERSSQRAVERGVLTDAEKRGALERIRTTTELQELSDCDLVVEAVIENLEIKLEAFHELDRITAAEAILASNTSSISITRLAAATTRPARVIGMHFMNPVPQMQLVEVIRGLATSEETTESVLALARRLPTWLPRPDQPDRWQRVGKTPVECRDFPGFVSNRVLMPMINEAIYCLQEGVGTRESIDTIMKLGMNHPMGPLTLADFVGLDTCLAILEVLHEGLGDPKYRPCPLLWKYVEAGWLGRKSGRGFYEYARKG